MLKNTVIFTKTEEQLQGVIRGIEALDTEHKIGIIHGAYNMVELDEPSKLIAELAQATIVVSDDIGFDVSNNSTLNVVQLHLPESLNDRNDVIDYIKENYPDVINNILCMKKKEVEKD